MRSLTNLVEQLDSMPEFAIKPNDEYLDDVVEKCWLNKVLVRLNMIVAFLYRCTINAGLLSKDSMRARELYRKMSRKAFDQKLGFENINEQYNANSLFGGNSSTIKTATELDTKQSFGGRRLRLPSRNNTLFYMLKFLELLIIVRYVFVFVFSSLPEFKETSITTSKLLNRRPSQYIELDGYFAVNQSSPTCEKKLLSFLDTHYGKPLFWNSTNKLMRERSFVEKSFLLEFDPALQMFHTEVRVVVYGIAFFMLSCCEFGSIVSSFVPYTIVPLVLIYEPDFLAFAERLRLNHYLTSIRNSYLNYSSRFALALAEGRRPKERIPSRNEQNFENQYLLFRKLPSRSKIAAFADLLDTNTSLAPEQNIIDSISMNHMHFKDYVPTVRRQTWRRFMMILNPCLQTASSIIYLAFLSSIYLIVVNSNGQTISANLELSQFLRNEQKPIFLDGILESCSKTSDAPQIQVESIQKAIDDYLGPILLNVSSAQESHRPTGEVEPKKEHSKLRSSLVADAISPVSTPTYTEWWVALLGVSILAAVSSFYINAFILIQLDLCLWLVELRMKLNICTKILKFYDAKPALVRGCQPQAKHQTRANVRHSIDSKRRTSLKALNTFSSPKLEANLIAPLDYATFAAGSGSETSRQSKFATISSTTSSCNISLLQLFRYLMSNFAEKNRICENYALQLIRSDLDFTTPRQTTEKFLTSTYLDFRLFLDQIDDCRVSVNFIISYAVLNSLNLIGCSILVSNISIKIGIIILAIFISNIMLIGSSFFRSQCLKLIYPIYSILAFSLHGTKTVRHLAALWRRALIDLTGSRSKLSFKVYSFDISYATTLQVS